MSAFQNEYAGELSNYNAGVSTTNSEVGDATTLAALAYMWSDERMKKDKEQVGHTRSGLPAYLFRYKGESDEAPKRLGVMAQDVEKVDPAAVHHDASGRKFVDYSRLQ
jgi:hypothetical protein